MPSPATAVAADGVNRVVVFGVEADDIDDSDEELEGVEDESDDEEEEEEAVIAPPDDLDSSPSTSSSSDRTPNPNSNNPATVPAAEKPPHASVNGGGPAAVTVVPIRITPISFAPAPNPAAAAATPSPKRLKTEPMAGGAEEASEERKPAAVPEDSRRLFQRLWTDEDEIVILQGFLEFTSQRSAATSHHSHHHDTGPFYEQIKTRLQLDFNKSQLVEKLRRLKKKYRNIMNRMGSGKEHAFKSPHDKATFEISRKIWSNIIYSRAADLDDDDAEAAQIDNHAASNDHGAAISGRRTPRMRRRVRKRSISAVEVAAAAMSPESPVEVKVAEVPMPTTVASTPNVIDETVRSCLSPLFKELLHCAVGGPAGPGLGGGAGMMGLSQLPLGVPLSIPGKPADLPSSRAADEKWRKQQILELEVYSKRLELVQEQIKSTLEELRSKG